MEFQMHRSRSSHSMRSMHRPLSRASTTSAASAAPDMIPAEVYAQQQFMNSAPEAVLMQYAGNQNGVQMDPMMQQQYAAAQQQMQQNIEQFQPRPFTPQDGQYIINDSGFAHMQFPQGMAPGIEHEDRRRKNSAATATNDKELRELLARNETRVLKDVAQEVIQKERTPQAEKTKQLFAMLWLRKVCKPAKTSVPRNRVYSHYATRCGTERVVPLNPASFGKLVRVIFPGIQTRRLGVRGESKYHYVDLALCDEDEQKSSAPAPATNGTEPRQELRRSLSTSVLSDFASGPRMNAETSAFSSAEPTFDIELAAPAEKRGPSSQGRLFAYPDSRGMQRGNDGSLMYEQTLRFPVGSFGDIEGDDSIALPSIHPYCPPKTDVDTAEALVALYRTHCTSLIDCIRFCKEKQFFRLFTSFHGTLTVPVQKLFSHANLAPWIQECDYLMYQKMVRFVSRLTLQAAPPVVITILNNISTNLHAHVSKTFQSQPTHVLQAKLKPAATFASLLHRLIRVNAAAHAAANLLTVDHNREQMWREWVTMVNPKRVMEGELPDCGYEEVYKILTCDVRSLLEPLQAPPFPDNPLFSFDNQAYHASQNAFGPKEPTSEFNEQGFSVSTENVLDRWGAFLTALPGRFPQASTRTLLHCIQAVGTAALRDITIMGGASYQTWWVMKIFVDEMSLWLAALGGFLERVPNESSSSPTSNKTTTAVANGATERSTTSSRSATASRVASASAEIMPPKSSHSQQSSMSNTAQQSEQLKPAPAARRPANAATVSRPSSMHMTDFAPQFDPHAMRQVLVRPQSAQPQVLTRQIPLQPPQGPVPQPQQQHATFTPRGQFFDIHNQENQQPVFVAPPQQQQQQQKEDIDDSGICMSFGDDPFSPSKFAGFVNGQYTGEHVDVL